MRRQPTKAEALEQAEQAKKEAGTLFLALNAVLSESPVDTVDWHERDYKDTLYTYFLYRATGPEGGLVVLRFRCPGQSDSYTVHWLQDLLPIYRPGRDLDQQRAIERILCARNRALNAAHPNLNLSAAAGG